MTTITNADDALERLLQLRLLTDDTKRETFLKPDYTSSLIDPFIFTDMKKAAERIHRAIVSGEIIGVYADFDADGVCSATVLYDAFKMLGITILVHFPNRDTEGYGVHKSGIDALRAQGVSLIITVDVGITGNDAITHAAALGIDVIITDHHELGAELPAALAIIHPLCEPRYTDTVMCGAGVAYILVVGLFSHLRASGASCMIAVPFGAEKWLLDVVAIATVADMVPLLGVNRTLTIYGLRVMKKCRRIGVTALLMNQRVKLENVNEECIGFTIAPRLNAASRMGDTRLAFELLTTPSTDRAEALTKSLEALNTKRKSEAAVITKAAKKKVAHHTGAHIIVIGNPEWRPSLVGTAATGLVELTGKCTFVWGRDGGGEIKGSVRSNGSINLASLFEVVREVAPSLFIKAGGHKGAGGFSISDSNIHTLEEVLSNILEQHPRIFEVKEEKEECLNIPLSLVTTSTADQLKALAPYGMGNPEPVVRVVGVLSEVSLFGKEKNHLRFTLTSVDSRTHVSCFAYFKGDDEGRIHALAEKEVAVEGVLSKNDYKRGAVEVRYQTVETICA